ncbi:MAG: hypothetical protein WC802_04495 [Patescibacteria group bacterium]|jgi:plasmid maintenance system killer protein
MEVSYALSFLRAFHSLPVTLQKEGLEKIDLFADTENHKTLKVHKLHGRMNDRHAFSVNYKIRIIFRYIGNPRRAYLMAIDDHDAYKRG